MTSPVMITTATVVSSASVASSFPNSLRDGRGRKDVSLFPPGLTPKPRNIGPGWISRGYIHIQHWAFPVADQSENWGLVSFCPKVAISELRFALAVPHRLAPVNHGPDAPLQWAHIASEEGRKRGKEEGGVKPPKITAIVRVRVPVPPYTDFPFFRLQ